MNFANDCSRLFHDVVVDYHKTDDVDAQMVNPYPEDSIQAILYSKCWIDSVQWHLEDLIRKTDIDPVEALALKRRIDRSNQERTDMVEEIDTHFLNQFAAVEVAPQAPINTESPAWAIDRLSILELKIFHMREQVGRPEVTDEHRARCQAKLDVLLEQQADLTLAIGQLLADLATGRKRMKVYRQMKMYNDPATNPVLYGSK